MPAVVGLPPASCHQPRWPVPECCVKDVRSWRGANEDLAWPSPRRWWRMSSLQHGCGRCAGRGRGDCSASSSPSTASCSGVRTWLPPNRPATVAMRLRLRFSPLLTVPSLLPGVLHALHVAGRRSCRCDHTLRRGYHQQASRRHRVRRRSRGQAAPQLPLLPGPQRLLMPPRRRRSPAPLARFLHLPLADRGTGVATQRLHCLVERVLRRLQRLRRTSSE